MTIKVILQINQPARLRHHFSEDLIVIDHAKNRFACIDGASASSDVSLTPDSKSDAYWLAHQLSEAFARSTENDLIAATYQALQNVRNNFAQIIKTPIRSIPRNQLPTAAGIIAQYHEKTHELEFLGLGDCRASVMQDGKIIFLSDPTMKKEDEEARTFRDDPARTRQAYHAWKMGMNTRGGYPIFSIHPKAVNGAALETCHLKTKQTAHILMMSDGFERLIDTFRLYSHETLMKKIIADQSLQYALDELRQTERAEANNPNVSVTKTHDDASALLLEIAS